MDNNISWNTEVSLQWLPLIVHDGTSPVSVPLTEVWEISLCRRNWAESAERKGKMKRDSNPTKKMLTSAEKEDWESDGVV